jgi:hypothetical protein
MFLRLASGLFCAFLLALPAAAAGLTGVERRMVSTVDAGQDRQLALLEELVAINSGTMNLPGVEAVGRRVAREFEDLGFEVRWIPMAEAGRAGHLVAVHKGGGGGRRMLLIGHLDTVFEPDSPFKGYVRSGDTVTGPGVNDMKGGIVIMIGALRAMKAAGTLRRADVTVVLTGDEERVGRPVEIARRDLLAAAVKLEIEKAWGESTLAVKKAVLQTEAEKQARRWATSAFAAFELGTGDTRELVDSFTAYAQASSMRVQALYELQLGLRTLTRAVGRPVSLEAKPVPTNAPPAQLVPR